MSFFVLFLVFALVSGEDEDKTKYQEEYSESSRINRDSYIDAYTESHGGNVDLNSNPDREMNFPTGFNGGFSEEHFGVQYPYPAPSPSHYDFDRGPPQPAYGPPQPGYGPPRPGYGPPQPPYGPPQPQYGPPQPPYGPPQPPYGPPQPPYGPPQPPYGPPHPPAYGPQPYPANNYGPPLQNSFGIPYGLLGIFDKFKLKLDLITIFKILLKIVLFKKLVSFIAIIFLLLFIPWIKAKKAGHHHHHIASLVGGGGGGVGDEHDEEDDDLMMRRTDKENDRLNNITVYVLEAIENFTKQHSNTSNYNCDTTYCTVNRIAKSISDRISYEE